MSRTTARAAAMQMIFEKISGGQGGEDTLKMVYDELREDGLPGVTVIGRKEPDEEDREYITNALNGVLNHLDELDEIIGKTAANDRKAMVGISGLEQKHDLILSGKSGRMTVMVDRNGSWIYETLRITRQPENGRDVKLEQSLQELLASGDQNGK